jgi:hypothetical protein
MISASRSASEVLLTDECRRRGLASVGVNRRKGSSQINAPIARTTARTGPKGRLRKRTTALPQRAVRAQIVQGKGAAAGEGMAGLAIMAAPLMTGVRLAYPHLPIARTNWQESRGAGRRCLDDSARKSIRRCGGVHISVDGLVDKILKSSKAAPFADASPWNRVALLACHCRAVPASTAVSVSANGQRVRGRR